MGYNKNKKQYPKFFLEDIFQNIINIPKFLGQLTFPNKKIKNYILSERPCPIIYDDDMLMAIQIKMLHVTNTSSSRRLIKRVARINTDRVITIVKLHLFITYHQEVLETQRGWIFNNFLNNSLLKI